MSSGVKIHDEVKQNIQQVSMNYHGKGNKKLRFCILKFNDDCSQIVVEKCGTDEDCPDYDTLISSLPLDDVRYVCYDFPYINKDNCRKSDILLLSWHPEKSSIRKKMICASSFSALKQCVSIPSRNILEGDSLSEVDSKAVCEKIGGRPVE